MSMIGCVIINKRMANIKYLYEGHVKISRLGQRKSFDNKRLLQEFSTFAVG